MLGAMDVFTEAVNLAQRYEKGDAFRFHVRERLALVVPVLAVFLAISIALGLGLFPDRKSTRLNSSHQIISYAVFFLKKKKCACISHSHSIFHAASHTPA